ncbi:MAG: hypothetical protein CM15mP74_09270 [Halieaceae bacterium]|nr:MAG: hypothetical protein CM15mP74_09270 [Halieaceae bacterium]
MCTAPAELPKLAFMIRMLDSGLMSEYLRDSAKPDDVLKLRGPFGDFSWTGSRSRPQLFIAGGTGLSPSAAFCKRSAQPVGRSRR